MTLGVRRHGQTLPLHAGIEHPQDEVEDVVIAEFALGPTLGHGEVGQDKFGELRFRELNRNGRGRGLFDRCGHGRMADLDRGIGHFRVVAED